MKPSKYLLPSLLAVVASLSACGGGGGSSVTPTPVVQTCDNGAKDYPTCTPPFVAANLQAALPANYPAGTRRLEMFTALNNFRRQMGLGPLNQNAFLDQSTANHQAYGLQSWKVGKLGIMLI